MGIKVRCPSCDARISLFDDTTGKKVRCLECKELFTVGGETRQSKPTASKKYARDEEEGERTERKARAAIPPDREDEPDRPRPKQPSRRRRHEDRFDSSRPASKPAGGSGVIIAIIGGVVTMLLLVCGGVMYGFYQVISGTATAIDEVAQRGQRPSEQPAQIGDPPQDAAEPAVVRPEDTEGAPFPIDPEKEPLGAALQRLGLLGKTDKQMFGVDPKKSFELVRRDENLKPVYKEKSTKGRDVRKSFAFLKAFTLKDDESQELRDNTSAIVRSSVAATAAREAREGKLPKYPLDPEKEEFAAKFVKYFSAAEMAHFESINPDADLKLPVFDDKGRLIPVLDTFDGLAIRNASWILLAASQRSKLDERATTQLNLVVYKIPTMPNKDSTAEIAGRKCLYDLDRMLHSYKESLAGE